VVSHCWKIHLDLLNADDQSVDIEVVK
jgi:hypothetical protein